MRCCGEGGAVDWDLMISSSFGVIYSCRTPVPCIQIFNLRTLRKKAHQ
jgi:hypothetical protein